MTPREKAKARRAYGRSVDLALVPLLDALNALPGVRTVSCCSGHGRAPFWVHLAARPGAGLEHLARFTNATSNDALTGRCPCRLGVEGVRVVRRLTKRHRWRRAPGWLQLRLVGSLAKAARREAHELAAQLRARPDRVVQTAQCTCRRCLRALGLS